MRIHEKSIDFLYRTATGARKARMIRTPVVGAAYLALIALVILGSYGLDRLLRLPNIIPRPVGVALSLPFLAAGLVLVIWCDVLFFKAKGTPIPSTPPKRLVTTGPYAYSRNPILTGLFLVLFGAGFLMRSLSLLFLFTPLFIALNVIEVKAVEEPELEKRLGQPYVEYKKEVPMFFPRWPASRSR